MFTTIDVHVDHEDTDIEVNSTSTGLRISGRDEVIGGLNLFTGTNPREIQHNAQLLIDALRQLQAAQDDS
jgi:hypothetical protein